MNLKTQASLLCMPLNSQPCRLRIADDIKNLPNIEPIGNQNLSLLALFFLRVVGILHAKNSAHIKEPQIVNA